MKKNKMMMKKEKKNTRAMERRRTLSYNLSSSLW